MEFLESIRQPLPSPMSLFQDNSIVSKGWEELRAGITSVSSQGSGNLVPTVQTVQAIRKYRSWIYPCVNLISRKVSEIPFYLYKDTGKKSKEEFERTLDHPMIRLLKHPNKYLSGRQLKEITQMYLDLCGFAVVKILRRASGQPYELHPMLPHELVEIRLGTDTDSIIKSFYFAPLNARHKQEILPYEDVLYFHYSHPENPYMPFTPIQAMAHVTDLDLYLQVYEKDFFHNSARPDFIIIPDRQITETTARRMQEGWIDRHRGPGKQFKPAVLSESVKFQQLTMTARDFEFMGLSKFTRDHILAAYNVPEAMLGLFGDFNKASSITAETTFVNNSINKRLDLWEDVINHQLVPMYRSLEGYEIEHANAKPKDDEWELAEAQTKISSGLITLNEYRLREGLPTYKSKLCDVPWFNGAPIPGCNEEADQLWKANQTPPGIPGQIGGEEPIAGQESLQPVSNAPTAQGAMGQLGGRPQLEGTPLSTIVAAGLRSSRPALSALLAASRDKRGGLRALLENNASMHSIGSMLDADRTDTSMRQLLMKGIRDYVTDDVMTDPVDRIIFGPYENTLDQIEPLEKEIAERSREFFIRKGIDIADIVRKEFSNIVIKGDDGISDIVVEDLRNEYKEDAELFITKGVELGYQLGFVLVGKAGGNVRQPDAFETASLQSAGMMLDRSADLKVKSTKKVLREILQDGLRKGLDATEISDLVQKHFNWIGHQRAMMISRTELSAATNAGLLASYEQINKEAGKIVIKQAVLWPSLDERDCKHCDGLKEHVVKDFITGTQHIEIPVHPNCRCVSRPILVS